MNIFNTVIATSVTNVMTVKYDRGVTRNMISRAWFGLSLAIDGEIVYHHNGKDIVSDSKHLVVFPMGATYHFECTKAGHFTLLNFLCTDSFCTDEFLRLELNNPDAFLRYHKTLEQLYAFNKNDNHAEFMSVFYKMLSRVTDGETDGAKPGVLPILKPAMDFLEKNISNPELSNQKLAGSADISEVYFTKLFRQCYGISPKQYIQQRRINKSKEMLVSENLAVSAVAEACGYASLYHFCRAFKQKTGYTPGEYRNEFKNIEM